MIRASSCYAGLMRKLMWRMGRAFDLALLMSMFFLAMAALVALLAGFYLTALVTAGIALIDAVAIVHLIRTGSFLQPW